MPSARSARPSARSAAAPRSTPQSTVSRRRSARAAARRARPRTEPVRRRPEEQDREPRAAAQRAAHIAGDQQPDHCPSSSRGQLSPSDPWAAASTAPPRVRCAAISSSRRSAPAASRPLSGSSSSHRSASDAATRASDARRAWPDDSSRTGTSARSVRPSASKARSRRSAVWPRRVQNRRRASAAARDRRQRSSRVPATFARRGRHRAEQAGSEPDQARFTAAVVPSVQRLPARLAVETFRTRRRRVRSETPSNRSRASRTRLLDRVHVRSDRPKWCRPRGQHVATICSSWLRHVHSSRIARRNSRMRSGRLPPQRHRRFSRRGKAFGAAGGSHDRRALSANVFGFGEVRHLEPTSRRWRDGSEAH